MRGLRSAAIARLAFAALAVAGAARPAQADDGSPGVPLPALRAIPAGLQARNAALHITGRHVVLVQDLVPADGAQGPVTLSWQSERVRWMGAGETYPDRHFPELAFALDGAPVMPHLRDEVALAKVDVSALVAKAGLEPFVIADTPPFVAPREGASQPADAAAAAARGELVRLGAIESAREGDLAKWRARRQLELTLGAGQHRLQVAYDARPGIEAATRPALRAKRTCLAASAVPRAAWSGGWVVERFDLPVGLAGTPPPHVTLAIDADPTAPSARWFACDPRGHAIVVNGTLAPTAVRADTQGVVHVLRLAPAKSN